MIHNTKLLSALQFAAIKHQKQFRKGVNQTPFINHPIRVATLLAESGEAESTNLLIAAILHDVIEDTNTTAEEITNLFGKVVCDLVLECTDDKNLPSWERKQHQINYAPKASIAAKKIKLADKICNITDIREDPPLGWTVDRKLAYLHWSEAVYKGLKGLNPILDKRFEQEVATTKHAIQYEMSEAECEI